VETRAPESGVNPSTPEPTTGSTPETSEPPANEEEITGPEW
jgi:hypothetical protein